MSDCAHVRRKPKRNIFVSFHIQLLDNLNLQCLKDLNPRPHASKRSLMTISFPILTTIEKPRLRSSLLEVNIDTWWTLKPLRICRHTYIYCKHQGSRAHFTCLQSLVTPACPPLGTSLSHVHRPLSIFCYNLLKSGWYVKPRVDGKFEPSLPPPPLRNQG